MAIYDPPGISGKICYAFQRTQDNRVHRLIPDERDMAATEPLDVKERFLSYLEGAHGALSRLGNSRSLYDVRSGQARIYLRYSKVHANGSTFFGLRREDLNLLAEKHSYICFLWDGQCDPLVIPYADFEEVFFSVAPAGDNQYKVQVLPSAGATELYIARAGRFNVDGYFGTRELDKALSSVPHDPVRDYTHWQVQTLLGSIGAKQGFDIWIPGNDRGRLDWSLTERFDCRSNLPYGYDSISAVLQEIDVIWIKQGSNDLRALYEIEHSTPIYSGLLRLNDVHLAANSNGSVRYGIAANDTKKSAFVRQVSRPTFRSSGLANLCTFLDYMDVENWYRRVTNRGSSEHAQT